MHPVEYLATSALMLIGPLALGVHVVTLYVWIVVRTYRNLSSPNGPYFHP